MSENTKLDAKQKSKMSAKKQSKKHDPAALIPPTAPRTPASPLTQKRRTHPAVVHTAQPHRRKVNHKKRNPNSSLAFNHRGRFTAFKRRVHAQRRWVVEKQAVSRDRLLDDHSPLKDTAAAAPLTSSSNSFSPRDEQADTSTEEAVWADAGLLSSSTDAATVMLARAVATMDALYVKLDVAMQRKHFGRASFLKRFLRARRYQLRRELLRTRAATTAPTPARSDDAVRECQRDTPPMTSAVAVTTGGSSGSAAQSSTSLPYHSFHPPSTWLGVGRHPRSDWVDQRSGRYPRECTPALIKSILRCVGDDAPLTALSGSEEAPYLIPTAAASCVGKGKTQEATLSKWLEPTTAVASPPSPSSVPSCSQRHRKASLYVASYCVNIVTDALDDLCFTLLQGLYKEQRDLKQKQPLQFKARQRYVVGFQEVTKCLKAGRVKMVLLAADVEAVDVSEAELKSLLALSSSSSSPSPSAPETRMVSSVSTATTTAANARNTRKKAFQTLHEAVAQVQQLCGISAPPPDSVVFSASPSARKSSSVSNDATSSMRMPPLCVTCMSRQRLSYALFAKGSQVSCVGVMQAEKNRDAFKAVMAYGRLLTRIYASEFSDGMPAGE
jgi:hypothetical protein